ncbi:MAG: hypothetical protein R2708_16135 [Vicinamibacterales bacterium]
MQDLEGGIDRLYQGDLATFIAARNQLARSAKRPDLKALEKPSLPAWAVNQVYWRHRDTFDAVVRAAEARRQAHARALSGAPADIRSAESAHREAVRDAVGTAVGLVKAAGHPATAATVEAITRTCEALPSPEAQGRLVKPLAPAGLEALAGLTVSAPLRPAMRIVASRPAAAVPDTEAARRASQAREDAARAARERLARRAAADAAVAGAERELKAADAAVAEAEEALAARQRDRDAARAAVRQARRDRDAI